MKTQHGLTINNERVIILKEYKTKGLKYLCKRANGKEFKTNFITKIQNHENI